MINAIRRIIVEELPAYGFPREKINITKNTSISINNDMLKRSIGFIPVFGWGSNNWRLNRCTVNKNNIMHV